MILEDKSAGVVVELEKRLYQRACPVGVALALALAQGQGRLKRG